MEERSICIIRVSERRRFVRYKFLETNLLWILEMRLTDNSYVLKLLTQILSCNSYAGKELSLKRTQVQLNCCISFLRHVHPINV
ncbi:uncharacterized protein LOC143154992 [Ptiloglossa arizonensis]|uniref:uncharacterized protein LOC143154992 n=1 Tax=Ptiloglossa arizonensis TaxID=3350558 RepID=UPI003FA08EB3